MSDPQTTERPKRDCPREQISLCIWPHCEDNAEVCLAPNTRSKTTRAHQLVDQANRLIAAMPAYTRAVEQMLMHEQSGDEGWWKGWAMLKAAHKKAGFNVE